ncbi:hypothetical protein [Micromonospora sp. NPDC049102]|uniref:hypothetical protein n=1 Tax=Micromonospora sp. NPDC049102 TaxID=3364265 RepID=UPI0037107824
MGSNPTEGTTKDVVRVFENSLVHPPEIRARARQMFLSGNTVADTARAVGLPYLTVWH